MPRWMKTSPSLKHVEKGYPESLAVRDPAVKVACYNQISLPAAQQLFKLIDLVRPDLSLVKCPVLLIASRLDRAVGAGNGLRIFKALGTGEKEIFWVERSGHMVTLDYDKELVFQRIVKFIREKR